MNKRKIFLCEKKKKKNKNLKKMFLKKLTIKSLKYQKKSKIISFQKMYASDLKIDVKFSCENELVDKLSSNLVSEENHKFSYYDSSSDSYPLGKKDIWLFKKDGNWECKAALANEQNETHINKKPTEVLPTYRESFGELEIRRELNLQQDVTKQPQRTLEEDLKLKSIEPICNFSSNIKTYKLNDLKISIENTDFNYHHGTLSAEISNATSEGKTIIL